MIKLNNEKQKGDPSAKFHFRPKCLAEKELLEKDENKKSDNENDDEEIRLKGK